MSRHLIEEDVADLSPVDVKREPRLSLPMSEPQFELQEDGKQAIHS